MEPSWDYNSGTESQKAPKTVTPTRDQESVMWFFWDRGLYTKWRIIDSLKQSSSDPLHDQEGMFSFKVLSCWCWLSRYFCPCSMHNADIQCTVVGREKAKRKRKSFMFKFFMSCHKIWILFHTTLPYACIILVDLLKILIKCRWEKLSLWRIPKDTQSNPSSTHIAGPRSECPSVGYGGHVA